MKVTQKLIRTVCDGRTEIGHVEFQRMFGLKSWAQAGRLLDRMEKKKLVGPYNGSKPRKVLRKDGG